VTVVPAVAPTPPNTRAFSVERVVASSIEAWPLPQLCGNSAGVTAASETASAMASSPGRVLTIDGRSDPRLRVGILTSHPPFASFYAMDATGDPGALLPKIWNQMRHAPYTPASGIRRA
jgi:hypothetical protein